MTLDSQTIAEFKNTLVESKSRIEGELSKFTTTDETGEREVNFPENLGSEQSENANEVEEYTDRLGIEKSLETQLNDINDALERIEQGTYGKDLETGEDIPVERLKAYPAARKSVR